MNLNASPETIRAIAEMFKLASFFDDRIGHADQGRIAAWSEQVQRHELGREDLLDGLQKFYDGPSQHAIGIGDLIQNARACRRDRNEREDDRQREERAAAREQLAAVDAESLAAAVMLGPTSTTPRLDVARNALQNTTGREDSVAAIREFCAAKREAAKR